MSLRRSEKGRQMRAMTRARTRHLGKSSRINKYRNLVVAADSQPVGSFFVSQSCFAVSFGFLSRVFQTTILSLY